MKYFRLSGFMLLLVVACIFTSCSGGKNPVELKSPEQSSLPDYIGVAESNDISNQTMLAVYDAVIDPVAKTFNITPSERIADYHFPLTQLYPNCLQIVGYGWTPNFWADIKLTHPLPGSGIDGFDPRVIAILPANPGVSFNYPIFNCIGNNSVVMEPDGYTKLFDNLAASIPGNTNPFKAYFKDQPYRVWSSTGVTSETQRWNLNLAGFGGPIQFKLVVDISTNYPNPPQPVVDNAPEPVEIKAEVKNDLPIGGSATVEVLLKDWQGYNNINCVLESPSLFNGVAQLSYTGQGPYPDTYIFTGTITNELHAPESEYKVLIAAWDTATLIPIFDETIAIVSSEIAFNPVEVTPPLLNGAPLDIFVDGNYLYWTRSAGYYDSLQIVDISDPANPIWVKTIVFDADTYDFHLADGYAFIATLYGLQVMDIDPPESAALIQTIDIDMVISKVFVTGGYAYLITTDRLIIMDVDPLDSAHIVKNVNPPDTYNDIFVSGEYAYATPSHAGLHIFDIDPPEAAHFVKSVPDLNNGYNVYVKGSYAYVTDGEYGNLNIVDIEPPVAAYVVKTIHTPGTSYAVQVSNGYAYVADGAEGLWVVDVEPPQSAYVTDSFKTDGLTKGVFVYGDYAYILNGVILYGRATGIHILDIGIPDTVVLVKSLDTYRVVSDIIIEDKYVYTLDSGGKELKIADISNPESPHILKSLAIPSAVPEFCISSGYAYVPTQYYGVQIADIDPPESAYIVRSIQEREINSVDVSNGYAYTGTWDIGLSIWDIDPLDSAYLINSVAMPSATDISVKGGYAFVNNIAANMQIVDIDPPESAKIINTISPLEAWGITVDNGYAYIADSTDGMVIVDIDPPEAAYIVNRMELSGIVYSIYVSGNYAYVAEWTRGLTIVDVNQPESAHEELTIESLRAIHDVYVQDNYAYAADSGLRIFKLY